MQVDWDSWIVRPVIRKVSNKNLIKIDGHVLQLPPGHAGLHVYLRRYEDRYAVFTVNTLVDTFHKS